MLHSVVTSDNIVSALISSSYFFGVILLGLLNENLFSNMVYKQHHREGEAMVFIRGLLNLNYSSLFSTSPNE